MNSVTVMNISCVPSAKCVQLSPELSVEKVFHEIWCWTRIFTCLICGMIVFPGFRKHVYFFVLKI